MPGKSGVPCIAPNDWGRTSKAVCYEWTKTADLELHQHATTADMNGDQGMPTNTACSSWWYHGCDIAQDAHSIQTTQKGKYIISTRSLQWDHGLMDMVQQACTSELEKSTMPTCQHNVHAPPTQPRGQWLVCCTKTLSTSSQQHMEWTKFGTVI